MYLLDPIDGSDQRLVLSLSTLLLVLFQPARVFLPLPCARARATVRQ
jgi:hypothetical protein